MPNWTSPSTPTNNIVTLSHWRSNIIYNEMVINDFFGHTDGSHRSLSDGLVLIGDGEGSIDGIVGSNFKGVIMAGDGAERPTPLTAGADDTVLRGEASESVGVKWEAPNWDVAEAMAYGYD